MTFVSASQGDADTKVASLARIGRLDMVDLNQWNLIETLTPDSATVVSEESTVRGWASIERRLHPARDIDLTKVIEAVRQSGTRFTSDMRSNHRRQTFHIDALPVLGPSGEAHGIQLWVGDAATDVAPPRIAAAVSWSLERMVILQTLEASLMTGVVPENHVPERTPGEHFAKTPRFENEEALYALSLNPQPGARWDGAAMVEHADGRTMKWHAWTKASMRPGELGTRTLWHDISDAGAPTPPTFAELAMEKAAYGADHYTAVFDLDSRALLRWIPHDYAPPWAQWRDLESANDLIMPADYAEFDKAGARLDNLDDVVHDVRLRLRGIDQEWEEATCSITRHPGELSDRLLVVRLQRA